MVDNVATRKSAPGAEGANCCLNPVYEALSNRQTGPARATPNYSNATPRVDYSDPIVKYKLRTRVICIHASYNQVLTTQLTI